MPARDIQTVLVVDDEPVVLQLVTRVLERADFRVLEARSEEEAVRLASTPAPSVGAIILDASVFEGGLGAALERLGSAVGPVGMVVVSGAPLDGADAALLERSHHRYLSKPFGPRELIEAIQGVMHL